MKFGELSRMERRKSCATRATVAQSDKRRGTLLAGRSRVAAGGFQSGELVLMFALRW